MSGDPNNFFREQTVAKSRKAYVCTLCRREIPTGSSYVRVTKASCGERTSHPAHTECLAAALEAMPPATPFRAESQPPNHGDFLGHG